MVYNGQPCQLLLTAITREFIHFNESKENKNEKILMILDNLSENRLLKKADVDS